MSDVNRDPVRWERSMTQDKEGQYVAFHDYALLLDAHDTLRAQLSEAQARLATKRELLERLRFLCTDLIPDETAEEVRGSTEVDDIISCLIDTTAAPVSQAAQAAQTVAVPDGLRAVVVAHIADLRKCASEIRKSDVADLFAATAVEFDAACDELEAALSAPATPSKVEDDVARDAAVGAAIERAARDLPFGYDIRIEIENGAGTVSLYGPDCEEIRLDFDGDTFAGEINTAIDTARTIHQHDADADAMPPAPRMENGYE